jgi:hypothetical protein
MAMVFRFLHLLLFRLSQLRWLQLLLKLLLLELLFQLRWLQLLLKLLRLEPMPLKPMFLKLLMLLILLFRLQIKGLLRIWGRRATCTQLKLLPKL